MILGKDTLLDRIASGMLYGAAPESCGEEGCEGGRIFWEPLEGVYKCSGHTSGWSKCVYEETQDKVIFLTLDVGLMMKD